MTPPTLPPEIEAAITAAAWSIAELDRRADVMAQPEIGALRTAITSALAAAREAGRREALEGAAGVEEAIADYTEAAIMARPHASGHVLTAAGDDLRAAIAADGMECRAVAQAVAPLRRENEVLRSNSDHLSSENASLASQVESMALRIESLAEELAKPEDVRLRDALDALDGRAVIFDGLGARVGHLLDEMDEWIERAGVAERRLKKAEEVVMLARQLTAYSWEDRLEDCKVSDEAKHDSRELSTAVWLYDQEAKS